MDSSILLSILCAMAWGTQSVFLKKATRDIPLFWQILQIPTANEELSPLRSCKPPTSQKLLLLDARNTASLL
jgi:hypothetical protein